MRAKCHYRICWLHILIVNVYVVVQVQSRFSECDVPFAVSLTLFWEEGLAQTQISLALHNASTICVRGL